MRYAVDPRQMNLFEPASAMFSPMTIKYLASDWPGLFRVQMLHLMPAKALGEHFDAKLGCPSKELYGMAGAIFLKEFFNLTISQTVELKTKTGGDVMQNPSDPNDLTIDDFVVDEETQTVQRCPNGHEPVSSVHDSERGRTRTVMNASHCSACSHRDECPAGKVRDDYVLEHTPAEHRTASRRAEQATDAFRENYAIRGGGESVNAALKRKTGLGRLRVRGSPRVRLAVLLRCAGWNLFRALAALKKRGIRNFAAAFAALALIEPLAYRIKRRIKAAVCLGPPNTPPRLQTPTPVAASAAYSEGGV